MRFPSPINALPLLVIIVSLGIAGCTTHPSAPDDPAETKSPNVSGTSSSARQIATKAKDDLLKTLTERLSKAVEEAGPVAAINVCKNEAIALTEEVGQRHGVTMGRIGVRLRNPSNTGPDWAQQAVASKTDQIETVEIDDTTTGVLFPILLKAQCVECHGSEDEIPDAILAQLKELYPNDEARGFAVNDLRGWVWVEVPDRTQQAD